MLTSILLKSLAIASEAFLAGVITGLTSEMKNPNSKWNRKEKEDREK